MKPFVAALLAIAMVALGVAGCGDEKSKPSSGASATESVPTTGPAATDGDVAEAPTPGKDGGGAQAVAPPSEPGPFDPAPVGDRYDPAASDGKVHGDGSIEKFGEETPRDEAAAAVAAAVGFYDARARNQWARACGLMTIGIQEQLVETFGKRAGLEDEGCPAILAALASGVPRALRVKAAKSVRFTAFRAEGDRGFAIFVSKTTPHGFLPMAREGDTWRVAALSSSPL